MKGLCHFCSTSNVETFLHKGKIRCSKCRNLVKRPAPENIDPLLKFEDLPSPTKEKLEEITNRLAKQGLERLLKRYPEI